MDACQGLNRFFFFFSETGSDLSMFEALRDTIYSEVATLISQNESRPHFLIELFHALQLLNTDYLRQRALYALQVCTEFLILYMSRANFRSFFAA